MSRGKAFVESGIRELTFSEIDSVGGGISDAGLTNPKVTNWNVPGNVAIIAPAINWASVLNELGRLAKGVVIANGGNILGNAYKP